MSELYKANIGMGQMVLKRAEISPCSPAITYNDETQSFSCLADTIFELAGVLKSLDLKKGDRIGYIGRNHPRFLELLYASSVLGVIFVPINFRLEAKELAYIVEDAGIKIIFADEDSFEEINKTPKLLKDTRAIQLQCVTVAHECLDNLLSLYRAQALRQEIVPITLGEADIAMIMYTSGTTGRPKGALITHGNVFWNLVNVGFLEETMKGATLSCAPLFHIGGLNVTTHPSLVNGVNVVLHNEFDASQVLRDIERYKVSTMFGAPTMFSMMAEAAEFSDVDFSSVVAFNCGAAPVPLSLIERYSSQNVSFCQGYGLTETSPFVSVLGTEDATKKMGSAGLPMMFTSIRIVDGNGVEIKRGEKGEICVLGPNVTPGYWNNKAASQSAFDDDGWFRTGDIGYVDEGGYLFVSDRKKDMVITGGENVYPAEVEDVLLQHNAIREAAVIGEPSEKWGEVVVAILAIENEATLDVDSLHSFLNGRIARYKLPRKLYLIDALPRNPAGKIEKFVLRERLQNLQLLQ